MDRCISILQWIADVIGKIIAFPLIIPGFVLLYAGNWILKVTRKEY